jgi:hypothetical protein
MSMGEYILSAKMKRFHDESTVSAFENVYFFIKNKNNKPQCLCCYKVLNVFRRQNLNNHYTQYHLKDIPADDALRKRKFEKLKLEFEQRFGRISENVSNDVLVSPAVKASYLVSIAIAKSKKPLSDGDYIKSTMISVLKCYGEKGSEMAKMVSSIPLSRCTITRRISDLNEYIVRNLKEKIKASAYVSLALDESTDATDVSQLLVFIRCIDTELGTRLLFFIISKKTTQKVNNFGRKIFVLR